MNKDVVTWCDDLHHVKGNIGQLQAAMQQVMKRTPNLQEFNELITIITTDKQTDKFLIEKLKTLLNSPQLKICIKFKQLYENNQLPVLKMLAGINLKLSKPEKLINDLLDYRGIRGDSEPEDEEEQEDNEKNSPQDINDGLPPLPPIALEKLFKRVFMDKSFIDPIIGLENVDTINSANNSKLITKGEMLLRFILIDIIEAKYPNLHNDDLVFLLGRLLDANLLFKLSLIYNLTDNLKYKLSNKLPIEHKIQVLGNLFLSYLGGASEEYRINKLKTFINQVMGRVLTKSDQFHFKTINSILEKQFEFLIKDSDLEVKFEQLESDPFVVKLIINSEKIAIGTSSDNFNQAKIKCIKEFFNNKKLRQKILGNIIDNQSLKTELTQKSNQFFQLVNEHNIVLEYNNISLDKLFQYTIKLNDITLANCLDFSQNMAKLRSESIAYDNLKVMIEVSRGHH